MHRHEVLDKYKKLVIGKVKGEEPVLTADWSAYSQVPYAEHPSLVYAKSPYYTEKHQAYRKVVRKFVHEHVLQDALECEESGARPSKDLIKLLGSEGYLAARFVFHNTD